MFSTKYHFIFISALFLAISCGKKDKKGILPPEKMAEILTDVHLAEGRISTQNDPNASRQAVVNYYTAIYKKHSIDSATFTQNMSYYAAHADDMDKIYEKVIQNLQEMQLKE